MTSCAGETFIEQEDSNAQVRYAVRLMKDSTTVGHVP